jgi:lipoprotein signal peptidase
LLGWLNWLIILIAGVGAAFGFISDKSGGRNFCLVVMAICALRLWIGGGII